MTNRPILGPGSYLQKELHLLRRCDPKLGRAHVPARARKVGERDGYAHRCWIRRRAIGYQGEYPTLFCRDDERGKGEDGRGGRDPWGRGVGGGEGRESWVVVLCQGLEVCTAFPAAQEERRTSAKGSLSLETRRVVACSGSNNE